LDPGPYIPGVYDANGLPIIGSYGIANGSAGRPDYLSDPELRALARKISLKRPDAGAGNCAAEV